MNEVYNYLITNRIELINETNKSWIFKYKIFTITVPKNYDNHRKAGTCFDIKPNLAYINEFHYNKYLTTIDEFIEGTSKFNYDDIEPLFNAIIDKTFDTLEAVKPFWFHSYRKTISMDTRSLYEYFNLYVDLDNHTIIYVKHGKYFIENYSTNIELFYNMTHYEFTPFKILTDFNGLDGIHSHDVNTYNYLYNLIYTKPIYYKDHYVYAFLDYWHIDNKLSNKENSDGVKERHIKENAIRKRLGLPEFYAEDGSYK